MNWEKMLDQYGILIERKLNDYLTENIKVAEAYHPFIKKVYTQMRDYVLRKGKRLASCSTLLTYKGYTGKIDDRILSICIGIELYRHCILAHDDLIDRDNFRRGGETLHRLIAKGYDERLGEGTAVFLGNIMYTLALQSILDSGFRYGKLKQVIRLLMIGYRNVNESQILDLLFEYKEPDVDEWTIMASRRAASLFKTTILTGAILAGAPKNDISLLKAAATHIGYAFDIQDDIIDTFATQQQYGRPPGGDIALGKKPLHIVYLVKLIKRIKRTELNTVRKIIGQKSIKSTELEIIKTALKESGALNAAKEKSRMHAETAKKLVAQTNLNKETKNFLASFITYIEESLDWYK
ncbi:polyprenyl synthetase family protein [Candidatus Bathyarchaeota archaeon]|nr:polyprenyl synthetase family protein [Candidatus Bathyarchaeota archaeon]